MKRIVWIALLFCLTTPSFANQTFIKGGFLVRAGEYPKLRGLSFGAIYAFDEHLGPIHPGLMAEGWIAEELGGSSGMFVGNEFARLDDTFSMTTYDQQQAGVLATARLVLDDSDSMRAKGVKVWPVFGIGVGGYQLVREKFPAREAGLIAEIFFRLNFDCKASDIIFEVNGARSFGFTPQDEITNEFPEFAFWQFSLGFELPVRQNVRTTH